MILVWMVIALKNYAYRQFSMSMYKYSVKYLYNLTTKEMPMEMLKILSEKTNKHVPSKHLHRTQ